MGHLTVGEEEADPTSRPSLMDPTSRPSLLILLVSLTASVLEWFDFSIYAYFTPQIAETFFPSDQSSKMKLLESFLVFSIAFLGRPLGGLLIGAIGDSSLRSGGRARALLFSILLMSLPTLLMGLLPSYGSIGWPAIALLCLTRFCQGLSVGGQLMSSVVFVCEKSPREEWGYFGSIVMCAASCGTLLGGVVGTLITGVLTEAQVDRWGWRVPFIVGGIVVGTAGVYFKYKEGIEIKLSTGGGDATAADILLDPPASGGDGVLAGGEPASEELLSIAFQPSEEDRASLLGGDKRSMSPVKLAFTVHLSTTLSAAAIPLLWSAGFYVSNVWVSIYMSELLPEPPFSNTYLISSLSLFLGCVLPFPIAGMISDWIGRRPTMTLGAVVTATMAPIAFTYISSPSPSPYLAVALLTLNGLGLSLYGAPMLAFLVESFPPHVRLTGMAVGYNIAQALGGGLAPTLSTYLVDEVGITSPGYLVAIYALVSLAGLWCKGGSAEDKAKWEKLQKKWANGKGVEDCEKAVDPTSAQTLLET